MLFEFKYATICTKMQKIKLWVKYAKSISMLKIFHKNFGLHISGYPVIFGCTLVSLV